MTQVPAGAPKLTVVAAIEQPDVELASIESVTGSPDDAVALTAYVGPPITAPAGADDVNEIVCARSVQEIVTCPMPEFPPEVRTTPLGPFPLPPPPPPPSALPPPPPPPPY